ncbi:hypothetical protein OUZ56_002647 [Daphnia magna]|uniref:DUF4817 domain-containing protein n=1 Tax=Daphnia magna TaxID=35525 RepID=A0ABR0A6C1_9CRUS|nr:hypothetical protein OUZ56_002647 [Daphnia magna]
MAKCDPSPTSFQYSEQHKTKLLRRCWKDGFSIPSSQFRATQEETRRRISPEEAQPSEKMKKRTKSAFAVHSLELEGNISTLDTIQGILSNLWGRPVIHSIFDHLFPRLYFIDGADGAEILGCRH